nr:hypothetical protein [bacterium]
LESGFFKGLLEVEAPADLVEPQEGLREYYGRGEAVLAQEGSALAARRTAQEAAINDAILSAVRARYPETSVSDRLTGRLYYLGSVREGIREGKYEILVRIRIVFDRD